MGKQRGEIGKRRREQIIEAAVAIIAEEGIQNLSLSAIEDRSDMSRGQLTYYFPAKEDILLAVFDHTIEVMTATRRAEDDSTREGCPHAAEGWERMVAFLTSFISNPPEIPEFHALQYTFLSQIGHRDDFRDRLAKLYEHWRAFAVADLTKDVAALPADGSRVSVRTLASFVQAVLHGLAMQRVADPTAYDRDEMRHLVLRLLSSYLGKPMPAAPAGVTPCIQVNHERT
jgi:AcrR family transcriptional regulator